MVAPLEYHAMVEFVNRTVTGIVSVAVVLAVLGSLIRVPRRRDLVWLSLGLVGGVAGQIVLGGLTVLFHLSPLLVMGHFLVSMVLIANAVVLHHRAGEGTGPVRPLVGPDLVRMVRLLVPAAALVLLTGTVVTGAGPHGGDVGVERLNVFVPDAARVHGVSVMILLAATIVVLWRLHPAGAPRPVLRAGQTLLAALVAQAAVGYVQYFTGVPELLVGIHVAGAVAVWTAVLRLALVVTAREPVPEGAPQAPPRRSAAMARLGGG